MGGALPLLETDDGFDAVESRAVMACLADALEPELPLELPIETGAGAGFDGCEFSVTRSGERLRVRRASAATSGSFGVVFAGVTVGRFIEAANVARDFPFEGLLAMGGCAPCRFRPP